MVGGQTLTYEYNADGIRTEKTLLGEYTDTYRLNGTQVVEMSRDGSDGTYRLVFVYDENGSPLCFDLYSGSNTTPVRYYYVTNLQGDVVRLINSNNATVADYTYDAWGKLLSVTDANGNAITSEYHIANINPLRYRGYFYDIETGLYYVSSRYYDPEIGRWINADGYVSTGQSVLGTNMFAYCGNNPVNRVDPTGQFWEELWDAFTQAIQQASGYFAVAAGVSQIDTPGPGPADVVSGVLLIGGSIVCAGIATYTVITAPPPPISIPKTEEKDVAVTDTPKPTGNTYYHSTTKERAEAIMQCGTMTGSVFEGGHVYAWVKKPNKYAIQNSGAHTGVVISFTTYAAFEPDMGIDNPKVTKYGPVVSTMPGPIKVWDVKIVG